VPLTDVVIVMNFEIEMEYSSGIMCICIPYSALEPIREKLQGGFLSEQLEVDKEWAKRFAQGLLESKVDMMVELGRTEVELKKVIDLKVGDVIMLDQFATDPLPVFVEGIMKFRGHPGVYKGNHAVQITRLPTKKGI
jgi:flagellar motor switch protein FliM